MNESCHIVCTHCSSVNRVPAHRLGHNGKCGKCGRPLFQGRSVALDSGAFQQHVERSHIPVLVDFWAGWCAPCKMMAPVFEQAASRLEPDVRLAKVDTERNKELAARLGINGIPTLVLFRHGREVARVSGAMNLPDLLQWVRRGLALN
ncbi:MAG: thioredoxin TrxC [Actinobacteria bacterium]|nr:thioredoxin TrxC [Actinomycetota bacterium]